MSGSEAESTGSAARVVPYARPSGGHRPGRRIRVLFLVAVLLGFAMVALAPWLIWDARRLAWDRAVQTSENLTTTLAHDIERTLEGYDLSLQAVTLRLRLPEVHLTDPETRNRILFERATGTTRLASVLVLDAVGRVTFDSRDAHPPDRTFADRDFFRVQRDGGTELFIGAPFRDESTGDWLIALSRPLQTDDGSFAGAVVGLLEIRYFQQLFEHVDLGVGASIALFNLDHTLLARVPFSEEDVGRVLQRAPIFRHRGDRTTGAFEENSAFDGMRRLFTFKQLAGFPLILVLGQSREVVLAEWRSKAATIGLVVSGLVAAAAMLGALLRAEFRRRSRIEAELGHNNAALSAILREMPDGVQVFNRHGRMSACNDQAFELNDLTAAERETILASPDPARAFRLTLAHRGDYGIGDPETLVAEREATARGGRPTHFRRQATSGRWLDVRGVPTADGGWLGIYRDVTEEVAREYELRDASERLEEQAAALCATAEDLARARAVAEQASHSKSVFLANMSHELRTPLNGVIGFADLMIQEAYGPLGNHRYAEYVRDIGESGRHLLELINDILDFSKADAGKLELQEDDVDVAATVAAALRMVRSRVEAAGLSLELKNQLPDCIVGMRSDERRLKQIVLNLVSNAIKFTPPNGSLTVTLAEAGPEGRLEGGIVISVSDTGIGIAAEDLPRVMEAFSQIDHGLNRRQNGTGLGLPLTKHLVGLHGGDMTIESEPNCGTTVHVHFPDARILRFGAPLRQVAE